MNKFDKYSNIPVYVFLALIGFLLLWLLSTSAYNVLSGDDMVFVDLFKRMNILEVIHNWYTSWTARITNAFTLGLFYELVPESLIPKLAPLISIGGLTISLFVFLFTILGTHIAKNEKIIVSSSISIITTLSLCIYSLTTYNNFFWLAGIVTYTIPLILFGFMGAYIFKENRAINSIYPLFLIGTMTMFICLLNEAFTLQLFFIIALVIISSYYFRSIGKYRRSLFTVLGVTLLCIAIIKFSPGTEARTLLNKSLNAGYPHDLLSLIWFSINTTIHELAVFIKHNYIPLASIGLLTIILVWNYRIKPVKISLKMFSLGGFILLAFPVITLFILAFGVHYGYSPRITTYTLLTANYYFYLATIFVGILIGLYIKYPLPRLFFITGLGCVFICTIFIFPSTISRLNRLIVLQKEEYMQTKNEIQTAKNNGTLNVTIPLSVEYFTYCVPTIDPQMWCNIAYSDYYRLKSIRATEFQGFSIENPPPYGEDH